MDNDTGTFIKDKIERLKSIHGTQKHEEIKPVKDILLH